MRARITTGTAVLVVAATLALTACGGTTQTAAPSRSAAAGSASVTKSPKSKRPQAADSPVPNEAPVPVESNPPGDIPDNTQFVPYRSNAGGFTVTVPEGWARTTTKDSVTFTDKLNTIVVSWAPATKAPSVASTNKTVVPALKTSERAFRLQGVKSAPLPAGPAVLVTYQANSEPNKVTGQQYRLDVLRYQLYSKGTQADITLLSPVGADNVDPWNTVTQGFKWS
jgi:hypothetical protein